MKTYLRSLLHASYAGAIAQLAQGTGGSPLTLKSVALSLATGAFAGLIHFISAK